MIDFTGHTIGRYQILESIGQGGMAVVYKALDTRLKNEVAIKFIRKDAFPLETMDKMLQRFEREALLMASLNHLNIVKVMDYGEYEGYPYLVMPYLAGGTLKARMGKPLPWREVVRMILPLTQALEYAHKHQKGALHRDIKPSNILMTESNEPVLTDFGIAKIRENEEQHTLTGTGTGMGTPEYMAPEQWLSKDVDGRADVYALGVVMYEMLTGRQPYKADTPAAVMLKQATDPIARPRLYSSDLPEKVERVVLKAMAKGPEDRYQSMEAFGKALEGLTVEPKPFKLPKWVKPAMLGLLGIGLLTSFILWMVVPGITKIQAHAAERGQTATVQAEMQATQGSYATQTAIAAAWTPTPSETPTPSVTPTFTPSPLPSPTATLAVTVDPNVPPACKEIGQEWVSPIDNMTLVCVPAGEFEMGSNLGYESEKPVHTVYLDAYWMDQTEVTNVQYHQCMDDGVCGMPSQQNGAFFDRADYFINSKYANYPVLWVDWYQASTYCEWAKEELPTEAQWEKSARGTDGRTYPWGNIYNSTFGNYGNDETVPVGSYPRGASPYGALDMGGNVAEWVADWYGPYPSVEQVNPMGPTSGKWRVYRGAPWHYYGGSGLRSSSRIYVSPYYSVYNLGFRCSRSSP